jgi:NTE family protein
VGIVTVTARRKRILILLALVFALVVLPFLGPSGKRPTNRRIVDPEDLGPNQFSRLALRRGKREDFVILAFSGGGTRAAAFSYGVLEALRTIELVQSDGTKLRLLDEVDVITGVSGGSFTALAYGLYGEKLFDTYEAQFLKRNVQWELVRRFANPLNWSKLASRGWGRSELAADLYDDILFHGATFADLERGDGPTIGVSATDLGTGSRVVFWRRNFDVMCSDLGTMRLARAAAASSAVPVVLSPVTINNYGGTCGYQPPDWARQFLEDAKPPRPAGRVLRRLKELRSIAEAGHDPYMHLVDGGVSDNLGLRLVLDYMEMFEALRISGQPTPLDHVRRLFIFVVNSVSTPSFEWNKSEEPPNTLAILTKAAGVPIDRYANESVELLKDIDARWSMARAVRDSGAFPASEVLAPVVNAPDAEIYPIEVSIQTLKDEAQRKRLNQITTSLHVPAEDVDRLRAAAASIVLSSKELRGALKDEWLNPPPPTN